MNLNEKFRIAFKDEPLIPVDRRQRSDNMTKVMRTMSVFGWLLLFAGLYLLYFAFPLQVTIITVFRGEPVTALWRPEFLYYSMIMIVPGIALSAAAIFLNFRRLRRRSDKLNIANIAALVMSIAVLVVIIYVIVTRGF